MPRPALLVLKFAIELRTSSESQPSSPSPPQRSSLSTCGNIKSACIKARTWACLRRCLRLILGYSASPLRTGRCLPSSQSVCLLMELRRTNQKTLLLFVIRDHLGTTPMENLVTTLTSDMERIWDAISKPAEFRDRRLKDYFDLSFTTPPHKLLRPDAFEADVIGYMVASKTKRGSTTFSSPLIVNEFRLTVSHSIWRVSGYVAEGMRTGPVLTYSFAGTSSIQQGPRSAHSKRTPGPVPMRRDFCPSLSRL